MNDIAGGRKRAKQRHGWGTAGASGLLAVLEPEHFATVDQFVVKALASIQGLPEHDRILQMKPDSLTPQDGFVLISIMKSKACDLNISHVGELKEKIDKQIVVKKEKTGGSRVSVCV